MSDGIADRISYISTGGGAFAERMAQRNDAGELEPTLH